MKNLYLSVLLVLFILPSCYTTRITPEFLNPTSKNDELFSSLDVEINEHSFSEIFRPSHKIIDTEIFDGEVENQRELHFINESKYATDCKNLIRKYASTGPKIQGNKGSIVFSVSFYDRKSNEALRFLSGMTFGILNLAGMPSGRHVQVIELTAAIYDKNGKLFKTYSGFGRDAFLVGLYYHSPNQIRPSFIKCVKLAIEEIDTAITNDKQQDTTEILNH